MYFETAITRFRARMISGNCGNVNVPFGACQRKRLADEQIVISITFCIN